MQIPILQDVVVILSLSVVVIYVFQRLQLPAILGLLITGMIAGPNGLSLVKATHEVEMLAEVGVILLLFIIGLEFSLKTLASLRNSVLIGGFLQVFLTIGIVWGLASLLDYSWRQALFVGFLVSLSSTAIVLKQLQIRGEHNAPHGRIALAILIFQDIIVVPMMLLTPILSGKEEVSGAQLLGLLLRAVAVVVVVLYGARYLIPKILEAVARTRNRELFILTVFVICFVVAWSTNQAGLSLALGAFLAGLIISESEYSYQATGIVLPFREIFSSFFFVSIGMLLDIQFFIAHLHIVLALALVVMFIKMLTILLAVAALSYPRRTAYMSALSLFQVGEFAFILAAIGAQYGLLDETLRQYFLATSIFTMAATPFVIDRTDAITDWWLKKTQGSRLVIHGTHRTEEAANAGAEVQLEDHVIIVGYGFNGRNIALAAQRAHIPFVVVELNPDQVHKAREEQMPIHFGDATNDVILEHLRVHQARVAVVTINDPLASRKIVSQIRSLCSNIHIIVRTHYVKDMDEFFLLGADEIIPEEFESSVEIFTRLLNKYLVPQDEIEAFVQHIRADKHQKQRPEASWDAAPVAGIDIPNFNISCFRILESNNLLKDKTLREADIRNRYGLTVAAIQRQDAYLTDMKANTRLQLGDRVFIMGQPEAIANFSELMGS